MSDKYINQFGQDPAWNSSRWRWQQLNRYPDYATRERENILHQKAVIQQGMANDKDILRALVRLNQMLEGNLYGAKNSRITAMDHAKQYKQRESLLKLLRYYAGL